MKIYLLIKLLKDKFNLDCSLHYQEKKNYKYRIYIKYNSKNHFKNFSFYHFFHDLM